MKFALSTLTLVAAAGLPLATALAADPDYGKLALEMMKQDFKAKGPATMERMVNQDETQQLCSANPLSQPRRWPTKLKRTT